MPELQHPDIVGNYLGSMYQAQDRGNAQKTQQFNQQRLQRQDERAEVSFGQEQSVAKLKEALMRGEAIAQIIGQGRDGDAAGFEMLKQQAAQAGIPAEAMAHLTVADLPRLREESGRTLGQLKTQLMQAQIGAQRANTAQSYAAAAASRARGNGSGLAANAADRAQLAQSYGIDPASAAGQKFALTGQLPAALSPTDKKAIQEADQMVMASNQGVGMLNQAKALNPKAAGGFGMGTLAEVFAQIGDETAINTRDLDNVLQSNVLPQLKAIFGGAPTEGERQILLDLQGSSRKTVEERRRIIDRSIAAANARINFYQSQAQDLRGGTYYNPARRQQVPTDQAEPPAPSPSGITIKRIK